MKPPSINHIGIIVNDLDAAKAFFVDLGLEVQGEADLSGEIVDRITALDGVQSSIVFMGAPGAGTSIELAKFTTPIDERGPRPELANALGIRHISFLVEDIEAVVAKLQPHGAQLFNEIQNYENIYKTCYIRGPEGIIIELSEQIG